MIATTLLLSGLLIQGLAFLGHEAKIGLRKAGQELQLGAKATEQQVAKIHPTKLLKITVQK